MAGRSAGGVHGRGVASPSWRLRERGTKPSTRPGPAISGAQGAMAQGQSKGIATKLLVYERDDHAIDRVVSEADHWINIKRWFDEHL